MKYIWCIYHWSKYNNLEERGVLFFHRRRKQGKQAVWIIIIFAVLIFAKMDLRKSAINLFCSSHYVALLSALIFAMWILNQRNKIKIFGRRVSLRCYRNNVIKCSIAVGYGVLCRPLPNICCTCSVKTGSLQ